MKQLTLNKIDQVDELTWPHSDVELSLSSKAEEVLTDFTQQRPLVVDADVTAIEAERLMKTSHVRLKFVVENQNHFVGLVSVNCLNGQEILKHVAQGEKREEISVRDFMIRRENLLAFNYADIQHASINDVVHALQDSHQQHCLVVEDHKIRGIFSASDITRKLNLPIDIMEDSSFYRVFEHLHV